MRGMAEGMNLRLLELVTGSDEDGLKQVWHISSEVILTFKCLEDGGEPGADDGRSGGSASSQTFRSSGVMVPWPW